jgi:hypothetical protein
MASLEGDNQLVFYYLTAFEIWPHKMGDLLFQQHIILFPQYIILFPQHIILFPQYIILFPQYIIRSKMTRLPLNPLQVSPQYLLLQ